MKIRFFVLIIFIFSYNACAPVCECNPKWHYADESDNCCNNSDCCIIREWPNTEGYTRIDRYSYESNAKNNAITITPDQKYYASGSFSSIYGTSEYFSVTANQDCKIIVNFRKFKIGYLRIRLNDKSISDYDNITIKKDDILVFEANPDGKWTTSTQWLIRFIVQ